MVRAGTGSARAVGWTSPQSLEAPAMAHLPVTARGCQGADRRAQESLAQRWGRVAEGFVTGSKWAGEPRTCLLASRRHSRFPWEARTCRQTSDKQGCREIEGVGTGLHRVGGEQREGVARGMERERQGDGETGRDRERRERERQGDGEIRRGSRTRDDRDAERGESKHDPAGRTQDWSASCYFYCNVRGSFLESKRHPGL